MRGEAPRPSSSKLAGVEVVAAEEVTTRDGLDEFAVALQRRVWCLGEFEAEVRPLEMSAGGSKEAASS